MSEALGLELLETGRGKNFCDIWGFQKRGKQYNELSRMERKERMSVVTLDVQSILFSQLFSPLSWKCIRCPRCGMLCLFVFLLHPDIRGNHTDPQHSTKQGWCPSPPHCVDMRVKSLTQHVWWCRQLERCSHFQKANYALVALYSFVSPV